MPVLKLVGPDSAVLRMRTERMNHRLTKADHGALSDMVKTLETLPDAIALAAPQVGIPLRAFVIRSKTVIDAILDPVIVWTSMSDPNEIILGEGNAPVPRLTSYWERCLSFPDDEFLIDRPYLATIRFRNIKGVGHRVSYQAWPARVVLHEIAHLDGLLLPDLAQASRDITDGDQAEIWRI